MVHFEVERNSRRYVVGGRYYQKYVALKGWLLLAVPPPMDVYAYVYMDVCEDVYETCGFLWSKSKWSKSVTTKKKKHHLREVDGLRYPNQRHEVSENVSHMKAYPISFEIKLSILTISPASHVEIFVLGNVTMLIKGRVYCVIIFFGSNRMKLKQSSRE